MGNKWCEKQFRIDLNLMINRNFIFTNPQASQFITSSLNLFASEMITNFLNLFLKTEWGGGERTTYDLFFSPILHNINQETDNETLI